jgi:plasmid stability protein
MAQILVRKVDERVKARIQRRAKRNGRSMEAEVREILNLATLEEEKTPEVGFGTATAALFRNCGLQDGEEFPELRGLKLEPIHFDE